MKHLMRLHGNWCLYHDVVGKVRARGWNFGGGWRRSADGALRAAHEAGVELVYMYSARFQAWCDSMFRGSSVYVWTS